MAELWERQDGESGPAFAAFTIYRDLGPRRSLLAAYRTHKPDADQLAGFWSEWSGKWNWLQRALAYDDHCDAERRKVRERRIRELEARRIDFEVASQAALEKWVEELDGELRASLTEGYIESEEELVKDRETGELVPIKKKTKVKFPNHSAFARLLLARHETLRLAVEGPRTKPSPAADASTGSTPADGGGAFVWVRPEEPTE